MMITKLQKIKAINKCLADWSVREEMNQWIPPRGSDCALCLLAYQDCNECLVREVTGEDCSSVILCDLERHHVAGHAILSLLLMREIVEVKR